MIKSLRIKNFRCFRDTGDMEFRPLTFLVGPNSSGKTSIIQFIECLSSSPITRSLTLDFASGGLDLGSFGDVVYSYDKELPIVVRMPLAPKRLGALAVELGVSAIELVFKGEKKEPSVASLSEASFFDEAGKELVWVRRERLKGKDAVPLFLVKEYRMKNDSLLEKIRSSIPTIVYRTFTEILDLKGELEKIEGEVTSSPQFEKAIKKLNNTPVKDVLVLFVFFCMHRSIRNLSSSRHIGRLRAEPQRVYTVTGKDVGTVGEKGENVAEILVRRYSDVESMVNRWLKRLDVGAQLLKPRSLVKKLSRFEVIVKDTRQEIRVNIKDVGFGVSQVMPVLIDGALAPEGALLMIEQPELHLHPKSQAGMGEVLADMAGVLAPKGRKSKKVPKKKTLLVETHSELVLARIGSLIAERRLSPKDCIIHYFDPVKDGTEVSQIYFDEEGAFYADADGEKALDKFLEDFLGADYSEFVRAIEAVEKTRKKKKATKRKKQNRK